MSLRLRRTYRAPCVRKNGYLSLDNHTVIRTCVTPYFHDLKTSKCWLSRSQSFECALSLSRRYSYRSLLICWKLKWTDIHTSLPYCYTFCTYPTRSICIKSWHEPSIPHFPHYCFYCTMLTTCYTDQSWKLKWTDISHTSHTTVFTVPCIADINITCV